MMMSILCFFKQKTAYEMRISDWSSDVCSSDLDAIRHADYVVDMGPGAGLHGGEIVAEGTLEQVLANKNSLTAAYLTGAKKIEVPTHRRKEIGRASCRERVCQYV